MLARSAAAPRTAACNAATESTSTMRRTRVRFNCEWMSLTSVPDAFCAEEDQAGARAMSPAAFKKSRRSICASLTGGEIFEPCEFANERELDDPGGAVSLFGDDQLGDPLRIGWRLSFVEIHLLTVDERDDVRVLLQGARFAQIRELRPVIGARLGRAAQLRQQDDRHTQLL